MLPWYIVGTKHWLFQIEGSLWMEEERLNLLRSKTNHILKSGDPISE